MDSCSGIEQKFEQVLCRNQSQISSQESDFKDKYSRWALNGLIHPESGKAVGQCRLTRTKIRNQALSEVHPVLDIMEVDGLQLCRFCNSAHARNNLNLESLPSRAFL